MTCSSLLFLPHCSTLLNCLKLSFGSYWNYCPVICDCHTCTIQTTKIWGGKYSAVRRSGCCALYYIMRDFGRGKKNNIVQNVQLFNIILQILPSLHEIDLLL